MGRVIQVRYDGGTLATTISMKTDKDTKSEYNRMSNLNSSEIRDELGMNIDIKGLYVELI